MVDPRRIERTRETLYTPGNAGKGVREDVVDDVLTVYEWNGTSVINTAKSLGSYQCVAGYTYYFESTVGAVNASGNEYAYFPFLNYTGRVNGTGSLIINGTANVNATGRKNGTFTCTFAVNGTTLVMSHTCTGPSTAGRTFYWYGHTKVFKMKRSA